MCGWTWWPRLRSPPDAASGQEKKKEGETKEGEKERKREKGGGNGGNGGKNLGNTVRSQDI